MKVLELIASWRGGGAVHVFSLATGLKRRGIKAEIVLSLGETGHPWASFVRMCGIPAIVLNISGVWAIRGFLRLRRILKNGQYDILHVHGSRAAFWGRLAAATIRPRPKVVFTVHGWPVPWYACLRRTLMLLAERVLQVVTEATICVCDAEAMQFRFIGLVEYLWTIPCGIDVDEFRTAVAGDLRKQLGLGYEPIVLMASRLDRPRDFTTLLRAMQRLPHLQRPTSPTLLIAGEGPKRDEIEDEIAQRGLAGRVRLLGHRNDVARLMALADVCVLTSYGWEGFPLAAMEAQASGTPMVITRAGGAAEAVYDGLAGLVVPQHSPQALAEALGKLVLDPDLRRRMGEAGQRRAIQEFDEERVTERVLGVYESVLTNQSGGEANEVSGL